MELGFLTRARSLRIPRATTLSKPRQRRGFRVGEALALHLPHATRRQAFPRLQRDLLRGRQRGRGLNMLPLFAYLALTAAHPAPVVAQKPLAPVNLHYRAPEPTSRGAMLSAEALHEQSGIIDLKEAAFGVLDRQAPAIARYARGPVVVLPLFAPTV